MYSPTQLPRSKKQIPIGLWPHPAVIARNNFVHKSLSNWAFNIAVGCSHGCSFCYVPSAATIKQGPKLSPFGVKDADLQWGEYVLLREWDESRFIASLNAAEKVPKKELPPDGNRAVIYCSTTDPYQVFHHPDPEKRKDLSDRARTMVRRSLEIIRDRSSLNVRILTRSPLARVDFDLYKTFKSRLVFGMSVPTLNSRLARLYEPLAPSPEQRMKSLQEARDLGLNVYAAMAPTFPESDESDIRRTMKAIAELKPLTVFHEPINIRAENVRRMARRAKSLGISQRGEVFETPEAWQNYAIDSFRVVQQIASECGLSKRLHLWPDASLGSSRCVARAKSAAGFSAWLQAKWNRISEWPA